MWALVEYRLCNPLLMFTFRMNCTFLINVLMKNGVCRVLLCVSGAQTKERVLVILNKQHRPATNLAVFLCYTTIVPTPLVGVGVK